jgi:hypothetical protein
VSGGEDLEHRLRFETDIWHVTTAKCPKFPNRMSVMLVDERGIEGKIGCEDGGSQVLTSRIYGKNRGIVRRPLC